MIIVNQDRDIAVKLESIEEQTLHTMPIMMDGKIGWIGLYLDRSQLGVFDTVKEAIKEMNRILHNLLLDRTMYAVSGHCQTTSHEEELLRALFELEDL